MLHIRGAWGWVVSAWRVVWARCACLIILVFCCGFAGAQVSVSVSPRVTSVTFTQSQQFAATVSGTGKVYFTANNTTGSQATLQIFGQLP